MVIVGIQLAYEGIHSYNRLVKGGFILVLARYLVVSIDIQPINRADNVGRVGVMTLHIGDQTMQFSFQSNNKATDKWGDKTNMVG